MINIFVALSIFFSPLSFSQTNYNESSAIDSLKGIIKNLLSAKEKSYQQNATQKDVEAFLNYFTDKVQYDHILSPNKKFSFEGKEQWKRGAISHLGETRNVKIELLKYIERQNIVVIEFNLFREIKTNNTWKASMETTVSILEFDDHKKVKKIIDYL